MNPYCEQTASSAPAPWNSC